MSVSVDLDGPPGVPSLEMLTLGDLEDKVQDAKRTQISQYSPLRVLMGWLREQIKADVVTQQESLLPDFVGLLLRKDMGTASSSEEETNRIFQEWQDTDAPNRRRYLMAQIDMNKLLKKAKGIPELEATTPSMTSPGGSQKKWRIGMSRQKAGSKRAAETDNNGSESHRFSLGQRKTGSNKIPLGTKRAKGIANKQDVIEIADDDDDEHEALTEPLAANLNHHQRVDIAASKDSDQDEVIVTRETILLHSSPETMTKYHERSRGSSSLREHHQGRPSYPGSQPPSHYLCNRCKQPGKMTLPYLARAIADFEYRALSSNIVNGFQLEPKHTHKASIAIIETGDHPVCSGDDNPAPAPAAQSVADVMYLTTIDRVPASKVGTMFHTDRDDKFQMIRMSRPTRHVQGSRDGQIRTGGADPLDPIVLIITDHETILLLLATVGPEQSLPAETSVRGEIPTE
ncbi:Uu.00g023110.m01.CDS01 [Anthostomella pinea]|uniref:Uu.00g023110.m01.CDS01 n=1 Tax=Anthostomella pinea TaxID=933095 RepID=A0AAI8YNX4_9PEZI|nr:Uu.00g023110.m01.CDS01 [Anthostomella pinea]